MWLLDCTRGQNPNLLNIDFLLVQCAYDETDSLSPASGGEASCFVRDRRVLYVSEEGMSRENFLTATKGLGIML